MSYKLIRRETTTTTFWYDTHSTLTEKQVDKLDELYGGDIDAFLDNEEGIDEDVFYDGDLVRDKDLGTEVEWLIEST